MLEDKGSLKLQHMQSVKKMGIHESFSEAKPSHQLYHHHLFCFMARCKAHVHSTLSSLSNIIKALVLSLHFCTPSHVESQSIQ